MAKAGDAVVLLMKERMDKEFDCWEPKRRLDSQQIQMINGDKI